MRRMINKTLSESGYETHQAEDGVDALEKIKNINVDLVLTDVNMPKMDGLTLTRELRKNQQYQYKPILILTTESSQEKKLEGKNSGATGWLVKPFDPVKLVATIKKVLG